MTDAQQDDETLATELADLLHSRGLKAESWQSGAGIYVVVVHHPSGRTELWGLSAGTWGGYQTDDEGDEIPGTQVVTDIPPEHTEAAADYIAKSAI